MNEPINSERKPHARRSKCQCCNVEADGRHKYTLPKMASKLKTIKAKRPKYKNHGR